MENEEYRIAEYHNKFKIQFKSKDYQGFLWWKKEIIKWYDLGSDGNIVYCRLNAEWYDNLFEAKHKLDIFKKGMIYHY